jgi:hypothetical protein
LQYRTALISNSSMANENPPQTQQTHTIQVKYEDFTARYSNHVLVSMGAEEVYLDFTSGVVPDRPGASVMPIHTRIVMTPSGIVRLTQLLTQTAQNFKVVQLDKQSGTPPPVATPVQPPAAE